MSSVFELVAGLALAAAAVFFVLRPIITPPVPGSDSASAELEGEDPDDDLSLRAVALRALKEIEFDRATGKLSDADYDALKTQYTAEALAALRADSAASPADTPDISRSRPIAPPAARAACPTHGVRPEADARFCSACGRRLSAATGFCAKCGTALEPDARFCAVCGRRVAA
ncbi:MAG TPA: zinc ribbon domain-containing protein [Gemmatimonadales bacterium]|nr:zinc ribbon domain-containing protein [Gemmatimonadales bacterium]